MNIQTPVDPTNEQPVGELPLAELIKQARRVLPGGNFGNMPAEVILR